MKKAREPKRARTLKDVLADFRTTGEYWTESNDGKDYWAVLASGYSYEGCSTLHEWSVKDLCNALAGVEKIEPY